MQQLLDNQVSTHCQSLSVCVCARARARISASRLHLRDFRVLLTQALCHACLSICLWHACSYPNWYPFHAGDENATFRFELSV